MVQEASLGPEFKLPAPTKKADTAVCTPAVLGNAETGLKGFASST